MVKRNHYINTFFIIFFSIATVLLVESCGSGKGANKAEYKKWKNKAKSYKKNPMALKAKEEACQKDIETLTKKNKELQDQLRELQAELDRCVEKYEAELRNKDMKYDSLVYEFKKLQTGFESMKNITSPTDEVTQNDHSVVTTPDQSSALTEQGVVFRVQIGAYQKFKIGDKIANTEKNFSGETIDNLNKYLVGRFRSYDLAKQFRKDIVKLGIKDAWVVAYNDGVRVSIQEALKKQ